MKASTTAASTRPTGIRPCGSTVSRNRSAVSPGVAVVRNAPSAAADVIVATAVPVRASTTSGTSGWANTECRPKKSGRERVRNGRTLPAITHRPFRFTVPSSAVYEMANAAFSSARGLTVKSNRVVTTCD